MLKIIKPLLLGACLLSGTFFVACQKDGAVEPAQVQSVNGRGANLEANPGGVNQDLMNAMAADANVQKLILEAYSFAVEYEDALTDMSQEARKKFFNSQSQHRDNYLVRTPAEMAALYASQASRRTQMFEDFPAYAQMEASQRAVFDIQLTDVVTQGLERRTCGKGYTICVRQHCDGWGGGSCGDDCVAGLNQCLKDRYGI